MYGVVGYTISGTITGNTTDGYVVKASGLSPQTTTSCTSESEAYNAFYKACSDLSDSSKKISQVSSGDSYVIAGTCILTDELGDIIESNSFDYINEEDYDIDWEGGNN